MVKAIQKKIYTKGKEVPSQHSHRQDPESPCRVSVRLPCSAMLQVAKAGLSRPAFQEGLPLTGSRSRQGGSIF